jgi:hypothetical protein
MGTPVAQKEGRAISLEASRCPDATIYMRRAVQAFVDSTEGLLRLESIEPSLERSLDAFLQTVNGAISMNVSQRDITDADRHTWAENYDEEDHEDVNILKTFTLSKCAV